MANHLTSYLQAYTLRLGDFIIELQVTRQREVVESDELPASLPHPRERDAERLTLSQHDPRVEESHGY